MTPVCEFVYAQSMLVAQGGGAIHYLEIGVQEGDSLWSVLQNESVLLAVGIDIWNEDSGGTNRGNPNHIPVRFADAMNRLVIISGDSHHILPGLRHAFDLIFVDGDHSEVGCIQDLTDCLPLLREGPRNRMLVDDLDHPKHAYLHNAVEKWAKEHGVGFEFNPIGYGVAVLQRS